MKHIPSTLVETLVEAALDQPRPSTQLYTILQLILEWGEHDDRRVLPCG